MTHEELIAAAHDNAQRSKSNTHRIDRLEERQDSLDKLVTSVAEMATKQNAMEGDISEIKSDVKKITEKSGLRWESIVDKIILAVVAAIVGAVMVKLGF